MGIESTPYYRCDSCGKSSSDPFLFRIISGEIKMGYQTLFRGYDFAPEVLCIKCFCELMGISDCGHTDTHFNNPEFEHLNPHYTGENRGKNTYYNKIKDPVDDVDDNELLDEDNTPETNEVPKDDSSE